MGDIFAKSAEQLQVNELTTIPLTAHYSDVCRNYIDAWYGICLPGGEMKGPVTDMSTLRKVLAGKYLDVQRQILGDELPE